MQISMREFTASGSFGPIRLRASREEVEANFGSPHFGCVDTVGMNKEIDPHGEAFYVYGGVELSWVGPVL